MARVTVTLRDDLHQALRAAAVRRGTTMGRLLDELLENRLKSDTTVEALLAQVRNRAKLRERDALALALAETRAHRRR